MTYMQSNLAFAGGIQELSLDEVGFVGGGNWDRFEGNDFSSPWDDAMLGKKSQRDLCVITITSNQSLSTGGLAVGCSYIRKGDQPINVTVTARNSDGSYQVRNNKTGVVTRFTPSGG